MSNQLLALVAPETESTRGEQINRYHAQVKEFCVRSEQDIYEALVAAWHAGRLLADEKTALNRRVGHGVWEEWLAANFAGSIRTAQRYMALARKVTDISQLKGMSFQGAYRHMGMTPDGKPSGTSTKAVPLSDHLSAIQKLMRYFKAKGDLHTMSPKQKEQLKKDFRPICAWLRQLYSSIE